MTLKVIGLVNLKDKKASHTMMLITLLQPVENKRIVAQTNGYILVTQTAIGD